MVGKVELEILNKYSTGAFVTEEDRQVLDNWASIGYLSYGYNVHEDKETAKLTGIGKQLLKMEKTQANPIKRFCRNYLSHLF